MIYIIIIVNLAITLLFFRNQNDPEKFLFIPYQVTRGGNSLGMLLSHFSHASWGHLLFNMISFFFFAPLVEQNAGPIGLFAIYILCAAGADALIFLFRRNDPYYRCLGASGSVAGIIFAAIVFRPDINIFFFFVPIPIPGPVFAIAYLILSFYLMKQGTDNVSHEAHIGGALTGFLAAAIISPYGLTPLFHWISSPFG